jgi:drug/metabolite transporter (DMT)-like permease
MAPSQVKAAALTLLAVFMWGCAPIGMRYLVGTDHVGLAAMPLIGLRYGLAALFFLPVLRGAVRSWSREDWLRGVVCAVVGVTGYNLPNALGSRTVSAGMVGLLNGAEPLMIVMILALQRRRWPGAWTLAAAAIGLSGIVLLARSAGPALGDPGGIAWVLTGAFCWSVYCVVAPPLLRDRGAVQVTAVAMSLGAVPMLCAGLPGMGALVMALSLAQWEILLALVVGTSVIAILAWNAGSAGLGAEKSGWFLYLLPVVSAGGGAVVLGEPLTAMEFLGGGLIMASVVLSQRAR